MNLKPAFLRNKSGTSTHTSPKSTQSSPTIKENASCTVAERDRTHQMRRIREYVLERLLGHGGFGSVYLAHSVRTGTPVAVKLVNKSFVEENDLSEYILRETEIMRTLQHPHIVRYIDSFITDTEYVLVLELAAHGELFDRIVHDRRFTEDVSRKYYQQLIFAIVACHQKGVCHRDLKAENLLLDENDQLKVCDFGLSAKVEPHIQLRSIAGSVEYHPPEMVDPHQKGYDGVQDDIWCSGVILAFMLCGFLPFQGRTDEETIDNILNLRYRLDTSISEGARDLLQHIFVRDPKNRYTEEDILNHPWFVTNLDRGLYDSVWTPESDKKAPCTRGPTHDEVEWAFDAIDEEQTNFLSRTQLRRVLCKLYGTETCPEEQLNACMQYFDADGDGRICRSEFIDGLTKRCPNLDLNITLTPLHISRLVDMYRGEIESELLNILQPIFEGLDQERTGYITIKDLQTHPEFGDIDPDDVEDMFQKYTSIHRKGMLCFDELALAVMHVPEQVAKKFSRRLLRLRSLLEKVSKSTNKTSGGHCILVCGLRPILIEKLRSDEAFFVEEVNSHIVIGHLRHEPMCKVSVGMQCGVPGFVRIELKRIKGSTLIYHRVVKYIDDLFEMEHTMAIQETEIVGDSELL